MSSDFFEPVNLIGELTNLTLKLSYHFILFFQLFSAAEGPFLNTPGARSKNFLAPDYYRAYAVFGSDLANCGGLLEKLVHPYLLRNLDINRVDQVWGVDITYVPIKKASCRVWTMRDSTLNIEGGLNYEQKKVYCEHSE
jgi:hypothetical protein